MIIAMTECKYQELEKRFDILTCSDEMKTAIKWNMKCYDFFLTFPDDAPPEAIEIIKQLTM
jgi:hypothetical protein